MLRVQAPNRSHANHPARAPAGRPGVAKTAEGNRGQEQHVGRLWMTSTLHHSEDEYDNHTGGDTDPEHTWPSSRRPDPPLRDIDTLRLGELTLIGISSVRNANNLADMCLLLSLPQEEVCDVSACR